MIQNLDNEKGKTSHLTQILTKFEVFSSTYIHLLLLKNVLKKTLLRPITLLFTLYLFYVCLFMLCLFPASFF